MSAEGKINAVVEIPTGTVAKWEVVKPSGKLKWGFKNGKPRIVKYLGYPGNYRMVPRTLLPKNLGGDGDPLDVIVLDPAVSRGSVVTARLIGVLEMTDDWKQDDKLISVLKNTLLYKLKNIRELNEQLNGVLDIARIWFSNYKGPGRIEVSDFEGQKEARKILNMAIKKFK